MTVNVYCAKCGIRHREGVEECMCGSRAFEACSGPPTLEPAVQVDGATVRHASGEPVKAGDLIEGQTYTLEGIGSSTGPVLSDESEIDEPELDPETQADLNRLNKEFEAAIDSVQEASNGLADDDPRMPLLLQRLALANLRHGVRTETTLWNAAYGKALATDALADIMFTMARDYMHVALAIKAAGGAKPSGLAAAYSEFCHHTARYFVQKGVIVVEASKRPNPPLLDALGNPIRKH